MNQELGARQYHRYDEYLSSSVHVCGYSVYDIELQDPPQGNCPTASFGALKIWMPSSAGVRVKVYDFRVV